MVRSAEVRLVQWLPWARENVSGCTDEVEEQLLHISPLKMYRRFGEKRRKLKQRICGWERYDTSEQFKGPNLLYRGTCAP